MALRDIQDLARGELESWCVDQGEVPYRARQTMMLRRFFKLLYGRGSRD